MNILYVYAKRNDIRVLDQESSDLISGNLLQTGWKHTATIDPVMFIEHLFKVSKNEDKELLYEKINSLKGED